MNKLILLVALLAIGTDAEARNRRKERRHLSTSTVVLGTMILLGHDGHGRPIYANCGPNGTLQVNGMCCLHGYTLTTDGWCTKDE